MLEIIPPPPPGKGGKTMTREMIKPEVKRKKGERYC
jgi:hypothetical protein